MFVFQICMLDEIFIMTNVCVFARFVYVTYVCLLWCVWYKTSRVRVTWDRWKFLQGVRVWHVVSRLWRTNGHLDGDAREQNKRTFGFVTTMCHKRKVHTDVRYQTEKGQTVTVRYCSRQKIGYAFPHVNWVTNYWKSSMSLTYSLKLPGNYRWLRVTLRIPVLGEPGRNR